MRFGFFWNFFVDKRFIFFFEKDSRLGPASLGFVAFLNQNFILISKTTCPWDRVAWRRRFSQSKFHFDFEDDLPLGSRRLWLLIPFLAKNSRLGYFFNARNPDPVLR